MKKHQRDWTRSKWIPSINRKFDRRTRIDLLSMGTYLYTRRSIAVASCFCVLFADEDLLKCISMWQSPTHRTSRCSTAAIWFDCLCGHSVSLFAKTSTSSEMGTANEWQRMYVCQEVVSAEAVKATFNSFVNMDIQWNPTLSPCLQLHHSTVMIFGSKNVRKSRRLDRRPKIEEFITFQLNSCGISNHSSPNLWALQRHSVKGHPRRYSNAGKISTFFSCSIDNKGLTYSWLLREDEQRTSGFIYLFTNQTRFQHKLTQSVYFMAIVFPSNMRLNLSSLSASRRSPKRSKTAELIHCTIDYVSIWNSK